MDFVDWVHRRGGILWGVSKLSFKPPCTVLVSEVTSIPPIDGKRVISKMSLPCRI